MNWLRLYPATEAALDLPPRYRILVTIRAPLVVVRILHRAEGAPLYVTLEQGSFKTHAEARAWAEQRAKELSLWP